MENVTEPPLKWATLAKARTLADVRYGDLDSVFLDPVPPTLAEVFARLGEAFGPHNDFAGWTLEYHSGVKFSLRGYAAQVDRLVVAYSLKLSNGNLVWVRTSPVSASARAWK